jgi:hypothetical protein
MKRFTKSAIIFLALWGIQNTSIAQKTFQTVRGNKAHYTIEVPSDYSAKDKIGANIDLKYVNSEGASIVTTVRILPDGVKDEQITEMGSLSDAEVVNQLEANGMENVTLIKRGFLTINNVKSYFMYFTDETLYYHSINQFKRGKIINLTITCEYSKKGTYMPYIFRVTNSLKHI